MGLDVEHLARQALAEGVGGAELRAEARRGRLRVPLALVPPVAAVEQLGDHLIVPGRGHGGASAVRDGSRRAAA